MVSTLRWLVMCLCCIACMIGCAPNSNGVWQPSLPWTRRLPANPNTAANPWASPDSDALGGLSTLPSPTVNPEGLPFFKDLMQRANQQQSLAERQRRQLAELTRLQQDRKDKERQYILAQREKEREALSRKYKEKASELAEREKKYRGQFDQMRDRATDLDSNNRDLHSELARSEKRSNLLAEELRLLKSRLDESTQALNVARQSSQETGRRLQAMQASASRRKGNAAIRANTSLTQAVTAVMVPGMDIRQDGDLVRISIPSDRLFAPRTDRLHQGALPYLEQVAQVLREHYPQQIAGIEAHTDHGSTSLAGTPWKNHHQLTAAQSTAVFDQLTGRNISPHQLFVLGHGGNHPLVSGGTLQGQSVNRRVEVVVYPETYGNR